MFFTPKIKLTEKECNAIVNQAYIEGYRAGYHAGTADSVLQRVTANEFRTFIGLPPIEEDN